MLGEMAGQVSGSGSIGDILGTAGKNLTQREQYQKAATKGQGSMIDALRRGEGLGPDSDNHTWDSVTQDGKGNISAKMNYKAPEFRIPGAQKQLEGIKSFEAPSIPSTQSGRSDIDYSPFF